MKVCSASVSGLSFKCATTHCRRTRPFNNGCTASSFKVFLPMHDARVNQLTLSAFDPVSRQPSYKHCAVKVERH